MDGVTLQAERILALTPREQRERLKDVLNQANEHDHGTQAYHLALSFNADLCTRIREIAEARKVLSPWSASA